ncbi:MAG: hypothetical protein U0350_15650 [Caldilineaceae bacterium]
MILTWSPAMLGGPADGSAPRCGHNDQRLATVVWQTVPIFPIHTQTNQEERC